MKVLAIDPGYERLGIAVIKKIEGKEELLHSECFKTSKELPHAERLGLIKQRIEEILEEYKPEQLSIENLFFAKNQKTALLVSEAKGTIISTCNTFGLETFEYKPNEIKLAVTGYGASDKNAVIKMIPHIIKIDKEIKHDDEYDAIAIGLTHLAIHK